MRVLKFVLGVSVIFVLILLMSLLLPSKVSVSKSTLINASPVRIDSMIQDFDNWKKWYPAFQNDAVTVVTDPPKPGIISSVSLKAADEKKMTLNLVESKRETTVVALESNASTKVNYQFIVTSHGNAQTKLTWNINTTLRWFPWEKIKGIFLDKISGPQYESALAQLKAAAEK